MFSGGPPPHPEIPEAVHIPLASSLVKRGAQNRTLEPDMPLLLLPLLLPLLLIIIRQHGINMAYVAFKRDRLRISTNTLLVVLTCKHIEQVDGVMVPALNPVLFATASVDSAALPPQPLPPRPETYPLGSNTVTGG